MTTQLKSNPSRWRSTAQAAAYLDCSRSLLDKDRLTRLLGIPFSRLGRHIRYDVNDLDRFLEARKIGASEEVDDE